MVTSPNAAPELHIGTRRRKRANQLPQLGTSHRAKGLDFPVRAPLGGGVGGAAGRMYHLVYMSHQGLPKAGTIPTTHTPQSFRRRARVPSFRPLARCRICSPARRQDPSGIMSALQWPGEHTETPRPGSENLQGAPSQSCTQMNACTERQEGRETSKIACGKQRRVVVVVGWPTAPWSLTGHRREKSLIFTPKSPGDHAEVLRQPSAAPRRTRPAKLTARSTVDEALA